MPLSLAQLTAKIKTFRQPIVDSKGAPTREFLQLFFESTESTEEVVATAQTAADTAQAAAATAQTSADAAATAAANAAQSSGFLEFPDGKNSTWTDAGAGFPAGDPSRDFTVTAKDSDGNQVATMVVRGALTTATGLITLSVQSGSASTGYAIDEVFAGSGTQSATATITVTFPDSSMFVGVLSWASVDLSIGGELVGY